MNPDTSDIEINEGTSDAQQATTNSLPESSRDLYEAMYRTFTEWRNEKELEISEDVLVTYFTELAKKYKPSSLWHKYSLLKATIKINHNIDIANYKQILAFLREQAKGYEPKPTKVLSEDNIKEFLDKAPDHVYLATKVSMIIGILGELRIEDLVKIEMKDVEDCGKLFVIRIPKAKTRPEKSITIQDDYYKKVKHYISLRPSKINHQRFFLNYQKGKCTVQPIGKNKFSAMPKQIAKFLDLPEADSYTGHSLRRSSKTFFANAEANITTIRRHGKWKSSIIIDSYVGDSLTSKTKIASLITSSINFEKSNIEPKSDEKMDSSSMDDSKIDADTRKLCSQLCVPVYEDEVQENETMCLELRTESTDFDTSITDNVISNQFQLPKNFNFNNCTVNINISK